MTRNGTPTRRHARFAPLALALLGLALTVSPAAGASPTFDAFSDGPFDDLLVDCGSYQVREIATFSATVITYADGSSRLLATLEGELYRTDDPGTIIAKEHARTNRSIDGTIAKVTGNRWHIVVDGEGMLAHDAGQLVLDFVTREVFSVSGTSPVLDGEFDFGSLCDL